MPYNVNTSKRLSLEQRGPSGGLQATSGSRPLVNSPSNLFVNFLVVNISLFILFAPKEKDCDSYLVCCFTCKCHTYY
jgi:hypothetical protein